MDRILNVINRICVMLVGCEDPLKGLDDRDMAEAVALLKSGCGKPEPEVQKSSGKTDGGNLC
jgi:hypothetical protein